MTVRSRSRKRRRAPAIFPFHQHHGQRKTASARQIELGMSVIVGADSNGIASMINAYTAPKPTAKIAASEQSSAELQFCRTAAFPSCSNVPLDSRWLPRWPDRRPAVHAIQAESTGSAEPEFRATLTARGPFLLPFRMKSAILLLIWLALVPRRRLTPRKPDVLVILTDQWSPRYLSWDNPQVRTPNLDRIAREGMIFDACYTTSPVCMPARISLITGLYPHNARPFGLGQCAELSRPARRRADVPRHPARGLHHGADRQAALVLRRRLEERVRDHRGLSPRLGTRFCDRCFRAGGFAEGPQPLCAIS